MGEAEMKRPNFFIVGAPKCGTTSLYEYLRQHPDVFMPEQVKEPHHFCDDLSHPQYVKDANAYLALFSNATAQRAVGEASVWYLYSRTAAQRIREFDPAAKIIIMLRNPADMLYSLHSQLLFSGNEDISDFEKALDAEEERKRGQRVPRSDYAPQLLYYTDVASYHDQVERYLRAFGGDQVHIILFDEFRKDTENSYKQALRFLGIAEAHLPKLEVHNPNKRKRSIRLENYLWSPPNLIERAIGSFFPQSVQLRWKHRIMQWNIAYEDRAPLPPELKRKLLLRFEPDIRKLSALINKDLSNWMPGS